MAEPDPNPPTPRHTTGSSVHRPPAGARPNTPARDAGRAVAAAGVPRIRLHDARHTCGTTMHLQGVPAAVIAAWLGHADVA
ncbi:tyrosine-type recombinase/integrase [Mycobacterium canetti]|uniref:tyrosine-type recombinase/integrase n=1 Tax=Mycobacterium canetti TaxID=78331 RepID=UPI00399D71C7